MPTEGVMLWMSRAVTSSGLGGWCSCHRLLLSDLTGHVKGSGSR